MALRARKPPAYSVPGHCIILPSVRSADDGVTLDLALDGARGDITLWLSDLGAQQLAAKHGHVLGIASRRELDAAHKASSQLGAELEHARAELEDLREFKVRVQSLERHGLTARTKRGPLSNKELEEVKG